jgi:hypothetical protein
MPWSSIRNAAYWREGGSWTPDVVLSHGTLARRGGLIAERLVVDVVALTVVLDVFVITVVICEDNWLVDTNVIMIVKLERKG